MATAADRKKWHRKLSQDWQRLGRLEYCELKFPDICAGTYGLAPAHSRDRRDIHTEEDYRECVAACAPCHFRADREMAKDARLALFKEVIANRDLCQTA